jgi:hypothetical protein
MKNHNFLQITNILLLIPFYLLLIKEDQNIDEFTLNLLFLSILISSQLFWSDPIRNSLIHKMDAIIAKITIIYFILYILIYSKHKNNLTLFILTIITIILSFYNSNHFSNKKWISNLHIINHAILHLSCFTGSFFIFD